MSSRGKFERTRPHVNVGTIGHVFRGDRALSTAIATALQVQSRSVEPQHGTSDIGYIREAVIKKVFIK